MSFDEFERRFIARLVARGAAWVEDGGDLSYGKQAAKAAWDTDIDDDRESPEEAADTDMSYWEE